MHEQDATTQALDDFFEHRRSSDLLMCLSDFHFYYVEAHDNAQLSEDVGARCLDSCRRWDWVKPQSPATPPTARPHFLLPADHKPQKFVQIALRCCLPPIFSFSRKAKNGRNLQPSSAAPSGSATFRNSSTYRPQKKYSQRHGRGLGTSHSP